MKKIVDLEKWEEFLNEQTSKLSQYEDYDDGFGDAFDLVGNWLDKQPDAYIDPVEEGLEVFRKKCEEITRRWLEQK